MLDTFLIKQSELEKTATIKIFYSPESENQNSIYKQEFDYVIL